MIDWERLQGMSEPVPDVPSLLRGAALGSEAAWDELWAHVWHQGTTCEAGAAALPALTDLARHPDPTVSLQAIELAGAIVAAARHQDLHLDEPPSRLTELGRLADERLSERPDSYLTYFSAKVALDGFIALSELALDFTDTCFPVRCSSCADSVSIVIGEHGHYSSIRDWDLGDVAPIPLHPATPGELEAGQQHLHEVAVRDGQPRLAWGLAHLFGDAECGSCGTVFPLETALESDLARQLASWRESADS